MNYRNLNDLTSDLDDFLIDVDELQDQSNGPEGESLDKIASAPDDVPDEIDDLSEFDV
jgi:hypothetical protein